MNRYGRMAMEQTQRHRPEAWGQIEHPEAFFARAGEEMGAEVTRLRDDLLGSLRPGETLDAYRLRGYQALATAEELVRADHPLFQPELTGQEDEAEDDPVLARSTLQLELVNEAIHRPL